ncbi:MAG: LPS export ABC transporter periplasmic protein LptC [Burkholderiales bacterium]|nr:LPS export ABC transporter periplasmic protein LptC [Burkholderiales bacterium]
MERLTAAFPLLLIAVLAALSFWLERTVQGPSAPRDGSARHDPDYIVENLVAMRMGPDGVRVHQLEAKRMLHYPDDDTTHLEHPRLLKFDSNALSMRISATSARVSKEGKTVDFIDDVTAVRIASGNRSELTLTTDFLHVLPDEDLALTDRPVTIVDANTQVRAVGLELNNKAKTLKLLSNVRGSYVSKKKTK